MRKALLAIWVGIAILGSSRARAAEEKKPPEKKPGEGWELGARVNLFSTADPFLDYFYEEHESVVSTTYGAYLIRHSTGGNRIEFGGSYTTTDPDDGLWLERGEDPGAREYTEFRGFAVIEAYVLIGHEWQWGPFGLYTGAGLGLAAPQGSITSYDVDPLTGFPIVATEDKKNIPPVVPSIIVRAGPTLHLGPFLVGHLDVGLHDGLYVGVGAGLKF